MPSKWIIYYPLSADNSKGKLQTTGSPLNPSKGLFVAIRCGQDFRSASDYRLSLPFRSPGPQLPHHFRHRADLHLRTLPAIHTTRPAPVIFHLVGSVFPLRSPAWSLLTLSPSGVPSVTPPTRLCRILGEATGDAGLSIHQCQ
ncbi:uncharacterized protein LOC122882930 isoform X2 [Siniperca chuatsi]|uniref:uncharacterized protein LOC122882930 isoform X2 n=1 Tax=Siniperca chuatsi TaxID=119488 RepID=UPI001CE1E721|nr:uncharacterized protein LOC122882930 isoform X2 [Siniperca chuatsi]